MNYQKKLKREILERGGEFIATGSLISDAVGGKWDNPTGAFNVALKNNLTEISVADDWKEARKEWKATGNVWYIPLRDDATEVLPEPHKDSHPHYCICGHPIAWHFEIENTENGRVEIVGSEHIGFWMIVRHLIENLEIDPEMVTEERVKEWIKESVRAMKSEWWWGQYGEDFEEWFTAIREQDLILNVRNGKTYWDKDTERYEHQKLIRKKGKGKRGTSEYKMGSIVWRWNHPDNKKTAQINTTGFPNNDLWTDLQMFFFNLDKHNASIEEMHREREERINHIVEQRRVAREEAEQRQREYNERQQIRRDQYAQKQAEENHLRATAFERTCADWGIPLFTEMSGRNDWEQSFLSDMISRINNMSHISEKQKNRTIKIVNREDEDATEKQLAYIRSLGEKMVAQDKTHLLIEICKNHALQMLDDRTLKMGKLSKRQASDLIDRMKNPEKFALAGEEEE